MKKIWIVLISLALLVVGCTSNDPATSNRSACYQITNDQNQVDCCCVTDQNSSCLQNANQNNWNVAPDQNGMCRTTPPTNGGTPTDSGNVHIKDGKIGQTYTITKKIDEENEISASVTLLKIEDAAISVVDATLLGTPAMESVPNKDKLTNIHARMFQFRVTNDSTFKPSFWTKLRQKFDTEETYHAAVLSYKGIRPGVLTNEGPQIVQPAYFTTNYSPNTSSGAKAEYAQHLYPLNDGPWPIEPGTETTFWAGFLVECNVKGSFDYAPCPLDRITFHQAFYETNLIVDYHNP